MMNREGVIYVGTCDASGVPNISPRTAFIITDDDSLLWCLWFKHKTYRNQSDNNHVCVAVVDSTKLEGYQLKGHTEYITDQDQIMNIMQQTIMKSRHANFNKMVQSQLHDPPLIVRFILEEVYSLAPMESSREPIQISSERRAEKIIRSQNQI